MQLRTFKTFKHMAPIKSEAAYRAAMKRIEELLPLVNDNTPVDDPNYPGLMQTPISVTPCLALCEVAVSSEFPMCRFYEQA